MSALGSKLLRLGKGLSKAGKVGLAGVAGFEAYSVAEGFHRALSGKTPTLGSFATDKLDRVPHVASKLRVPRVPRLPRPKF